MLLRFRGVSKTRPSSGAHPPGHGGEKSEIRPWGGFWLRAARRSLWFGELTEGELDCGAGSPGEGERNLLRRKRESPDGGRGIHL